MPEDNQSQSQTELKSEPEFISRLSWRIFFWEIFLFSLTLILSIATTFKLKNFLESQEIYLPPVSFLRFVFYFLLATLFILSITYLGKKFQKGKNILFKIIFILAAAAGGFSLFSPWMPQIIAITLVIVFIFAWLIRPIILLHDLIVVLGIAGIGSFLGLSLDKSVIISLLIFFSVYDFIAVYKTRHMVKMAKEMTEAGAILALIIPEQFSSFKVTLKEVKREGRFLILGGGDIAFPLLLCVSLAPQGLIYVVFVALFSLVGFFVSFWLFISQKVRQPLPALPAIALFSIIGFLITLTI